MNPNDDLRAAVYSGAEISEILSCLNAGADPNARFHHGWTPLLEAESFEIASLLLERGASIEVEDDYGRGVFHALTYAQTPFELAHLYRGTAADLEGRDCDGRTPLLHALASAQGHIAAPLALLDIGADPLALDAQGNNALHCWAMGRGRLELGEHLIELGVDPLALNRLGRSVADILADEQQGAGYDLIRSLVEHEELAETTPAVALTTQARRI